MSVRQRTISNLQPSESASWQFFGRNEMLIGCLLLLAFLPLLSLLAAQLLSRPHYQFFPLIVVTFVLFVRARWPSEEDIEFEGDSRLGPLLMWSGLLALTIAVILYSPWLAGVAAVLVTGAVLLLYGGRAAFVALATPWLLLWLIIPPPFRLDVRLIEWLQSTTSQLASILLDTMDIRHLMTGNILEFPRQRMMVEEACSGIQSIYALLACVGLFVVWARRPFFHSVLLLAATVFWAGVTNVLRVIIVAVAYARYDVDITSGWKHQTLGGMIFLFALVMAGSTDQLLLWWGEWLRRAAMTISRFAADSSTMRWWRFVWTGSSSRRSSSSTKSLGARASANRRQIPKAWLSRSRFLMISGVLSCLALLQLFSLTSSRADNALGHAARRFSNDNRIIHLAQNLDDGSLPTVVGNWNKRDFQTAKRSESNAFGQYSKMWVYETRRSDVVVSCDYPFIRWHDVRVCYRSHGWSIVSYSGAPSSNETTTESPFVELELSMPSGEYGFVKFGIFDENGRPLQPPKPMSWTERLKERIQNGPLRAVISSPDSTVSEIDVDTYQVQAFVTASRPLSSEEHDELRKQFRQSCTLISQQLAAKSKDE